MNYHKCSPIRPVSGCVCVCLKDCLQKKTFPILIVINAGGIFGSFNEQYLMQHCVDFKCGCTVCTRVIHFLLFPITEPGGDLFKWISCSFDWSAQVHIWSFFWNVMSIIQIQNCFKWNDVAVHRNAFWFVVPFSLSFLWLLTSCFTDGQSFYSIFANLW